VSNKTFDDFPVTGQEFQSQFNIDYYDWCKLVTPLVVSVFSQISNSWAIKYQLEKTSLE